MIKERSDFFQIAKFFPIHNTYNSPDDQCVQICMNSKFNAILQPVVSYFIKSLLWYQHDYFGHVQESIKKTGN